MEVGGVCLDDLQHAQGDSGVEAAHTLADLPSEDFVRCAEDAVGIGAQPPQLHGKREERGTAGERVEEAGGLGLEL